MGRYKYGRSKPCRCYDCLDSGNDRRDFRQDHGSDGWGEDLIPYKKPSRSNFNGRKKRPCKKSKTGETCEFTATIIKGTRWRRNSDGTGEWVPQRMRACSRCGKHDWSSYFSSLW